MDSFKFSSCVRGYHVYQTVWTPVMGQILNCERQMGNMHDPYAVRVKIPGRIDTVGHLPKKISSTCSLFLRNGRIQCKVTGSRRYSSDLVQGGMEIPCLLILNGEKAVLEKARHLLLYSSESTENSSTPACGTNDKEESTSTLKKRKIGTEANNKSTSSTVINVEMLSNSVGQALDKGGGIASAEPWLTFQSCNMSKLEKDILQNGDCLSDLHIAFALKILHCQFPEVEGLQCPLYQAKLMLRLQHNFVQILHVRGNHWIVVSNIAVKSIDTIDVYDSLYDNIDDESRKLITSMFMEPSDTACSRENFRLPTLHINLVKNVPKQIGVKDCAVYAIAITTYLLHESSVPVKLNQAIMRQHLLSCFENFKLTPFPII